MTASGYPAFNCDQLDGFGYWITSSARSSSDCGTVRPSAFAVFMLMTSNNLLRCSIGITFEAPKPK